MDLVIPYPQSRKVGDQCLHPFSKSTFAGIGAGHFTGWSIEFAIRGEVCNPHHILIDDRKLDTIDPDAAV